ncbi:hypothetical protein PoB_000956400 [Plakobranchus ocellatus]|uniref:Uncharacterized protein n=1 Tax=Plakobranchus ocellatus TaxID=259542 RepID=A0AAV3YLP2_9GAST|nr:hypothetical protein PoB_000956400 [Plakobranchus ocellatus]
MTTDRVMYIHIPSDILEENNPYRCPATVNLELRDHTNSRRRPVGLYPPLSSRTSDSVSTFVCDTAKESATPDCTTENCLRGKAIGTPSMAGYYKKKVPDSRLNR